MSYALHAVPGAIWLIIKVWFFFFLFAMVKAIVPPQRYRYDQLMQTWAGKSSCRSLARLGSA